MGMFDTISVKDNPFGIPYSEKNFEYQTRDLECNLNYYSFTEEGKIDYRTTNDEYANGIARGYDYTGVLEIYDLIRDNDVGITWIQFELTVEYGQVTYVKACSDLTLSDLQRAYDTQISDEEHYGRLFSRSKKTIEGVVIPPAVELPSPSN